YRIILSETMDDATYSDCRSMTDLIKLDDDVDESTNKHNNNNKSPEETGKEQEESSIDLPSESATNQDNSKIGSETDLAILTSWDALPWPPLERICHFLFNPYDGTNLANLAKVSVHYNNGVIKYMNGTSNRPGIDRLRFVNYGILLSVTIGIDYSTIPLFGLYKLDNGFRKNFGGVNSPQFDVVLRGTEDPIFKQAVSVLSTSIKVLKLWSLPHSHLTLIKELSSPRPSTDSRSLSWSWTTLPFPSSSPSLLMRRKSISDWQTVGLVSLI
ncbi:hypothetical protein PMAYCL1PPCAC_04272, partial [Pristionchus mayeri]